MLIYLLFCNCRISFIRFSFSFFWLFVAFKKYTNLYHDNLHSLDFLSDTHITLTQPELGRKESSMITHAVLFTLDIAKLQWLGRNWCIQCDKKVWPDKSYTIRCGFKAIYLKVDTRYILYVSNWLKWQLITS